MPRRLLTSTLSLALGVLLPATAVLAAKPVPNEAPVVTAFDVAASSASPVPVIAFEAGDADGTVDGFLITETSATPDAGAPGWSATPPAEYLTASSGLVTLYAWARDNDGAVSVGLSDTVSIPQPPIDADTLDGIDSTGFATVGHGHDQDYRRKYAQVVVVSADGNGDFTSPVEAMLSIGDASASNPYLVKIMPGVYDLGTTPLFMAPHVDVEGSGEGVTTITGVVETTWVDQDAGGVVTADNAEIRLLTVENTAPPSSMVGAAILNLGVSPRLKNLTVVSRGGSYPIALISSDSSPYLENVTIRAEGSNVIGVSTVGSGVATMKNSSITARVGQGMGGFGIGVYHQGGAAVMTNVDVSASQQALLVTGGSVSTVTIDRCSLEGNYASLQVDGGEDHGVKVGASKLVGAVIPGFQNLSPVCAGSYGADYSLLDVNCQ